MARVSILDLQRMKRDKQKIVMMTAYDFQMARILDRVGLEMILVGDSGARNLLGYEDVNAVTMDEMIVMIRSVSRGTVNAMVVGDMPFMSYQINRDEAVRNAGRIVAEGAAQAVKVEVGADYAATVEAIVKAGIPVMGHMGLTPMVTIGVGGFHAEGLTVDEEQVWRDARALQDAGVFSLLLTGISADLAKRITQEMRVPTIAGFGAGDDCDGQIGVTHGVVGFNAEELDKPKAAYGPVAASLFDAGRKFAADVRAGKPVRAKRDAK